MKNLIIAAAILFASALFVSDVSAQKGYPAAVTDTSRWASIEHGSPAECSGTPEDCALKMLDALNINVGNEPGVSVYPMGDTRDKNVTVVFVSYLPEGDDSVLGELYRLELSLAGAEDSSFSLDRLGKMYQCMDGAAGWRKSPCQ